MNPPTGFSEFGGGVGGGTYLNPATVCMLLLGVLLMWFVPRRYRLMPFLVLTLLIPLGQTVVVFGVDFMVLRIAILFAWLRCVPDLLGGRMSFLPNGMNAIDTAFLLWVGVTTVVYTILYASMGALVYKFGFVYNALGVYWLFRHHLRNERDLDRLVQVLAVLTLCFAGFMIVEHFTRENPLAIIGAPGLAEVRNGKVRAQGPFGHSILAGTFGAILLPIFIGLVWSRRSRMFGALGAGASTAMVLASASSTPVSGVFAAMAALFAWPLRRHMRSFRWLAVAMLCGLHLIMKAPVWALLGRVDFVGGSSGYHRFELVDQAIRHFSDWWIIGTTQNASWGYDMWDRQNWYVQSGITGGLVGLALFVAVIAFSFRAVGRYCRNRGISLSARRMAWAHGAALFAAAVSFIGVNLFDQSIVAWYAILAMTAAFTSAPEPIADQRLMLPLSSFETSRI